MLILLAVSSSSDVSARLVHDHDSANESTASGLSQPDFVGGLIHQVRRVEGK
jgi:hypothetical protein